MPSNADIAIHRLPAADPHEAERRDAAPTPRVLYIHPGTFGPEIDPLKNPFHHLSRHLTGDLLTIWLSDAESARSWHARGRHSLGRFNGHWKRTRQYPSGLRGLLEIAFFVATALRLTRKHGRYDAVIAYGPHRTGLAAYIIARLTASAFVLELPGHPLKPYQFVQGAMARLKRTLSPILISFLVKRADHVRLLYPAQLTGVAKKDLADTSVFHNFVPIGTITPGKDTKVAPTTGVRTESAPCILFLGHPWYLKGVDVLIRAFHQIAHRFPDHELRIIGHCPDRSYFEELRAGSKRIRFERPVPHADAMRLMEACSVFVLPSRTEAMGRVLLEAMAAARPIVASAVDGIPHYVRHEDTGLLFESENPDDLARQLTRILGDPEYANALALRGHAFVHEHLSEEAYAFSFRSMVDRAIRARGRGRR